MSRGPGRTQRLVLEVLAEPHEHRQAWQDDGWLECWTPVVAIAQRLAGGPPSRAQVESVRRAAKALAKAGRADCWWRDDVVEVAGGPRTWRGRARRGFLVAHAQLSVEERAHGRPSQRLARVESLITGKPPDPEPFVPWVPRREQGW